jgi:UDP-N-acetylglucosamine 2-epimerase (non-hydrolysing)
MSQVFFDELEIPEPDINLGIGSASHGVQTGAMLGQIEQVLLDARPEWVLVYGDTNSTLAGALAAAKLHIPVAHVEAGLRSLNKAMPEEINRVLTDHIADLLFCPTKTAVKNLASEGITDGVYHTGDVMYDAVLYYAGIAEERSTVLKDLGVDAGSYLLATVHRPRNTDNLNRLRSILGAFADARKTIVFPAHPRTRKALADDTLSVPGNVQVCEPIGYLDMIQLERNAWMILTDSGGIQKEAYFFGVPCVTLREETEWIETVEAGWNVLVGADREKIVRAVSTFTSPKTHHKLFGDGHAAEQFVRLLEQDATEASDCT